MSTTSPLAAAADDAAAAPEAVRTLLARWHRAECLIAVCAFAFIALVLIADVLGREALGPLLRFAGMEKAATGVPAAQRLSVYALVIGSFCGIGIAAATGSHLVPRVAFGWLPRRWSPVVDRVADVTTGAFLVAVAAYGWVYVQSSIATDLRAPILNWPVWPFQLAIPLGFVSAALRYFVWAAWPALRPLPPEFQE